MKNTLQNLIDSMKHAGWSGQDVTIGGGEYLAEDLGELAVEIEKLRRPSASHETTEADYSLIELRLLARSILDNWKAGQGGMASLMDQLEAALGNSGTHKVLEDFIKVYDEPIDPDSAKRLVHKFRQAYPKLYQLMGRIVRKVPEKMENL